jgi:hypothetical protein
MSARSRWGLIAGLVLAGFLLAVLGFAVGPQKASPEGPGAAAGPGVTPPAVAPVAEEAAPPREAIAAGGEASAAGPATPGPEELWGRVIARDTQAGVAGAAVQLQHRRADEFSLDLVLGSEVTSLAKAASDADGRFRFAVERARPHRLRVEAAGYAPATLASCTGGSEVVVELTRGASIEGVVRCGGQGMADVPIRVAVVNQNIELAAGRTDPSGMYRFSDLPPADAYVAVRSPQHQEKWEFVELLPDVAHRLDIEVDAGRALRGRVVDAVTRAPIAGAEVSESWTFARTVRSGADGGFVLPGLRDGNWRPLHARAQGYAAFSANVAGALGKEAEVALVRGGEVSGRCVTVEGAPVRSADVAVGASHSDGAGIHTDLIRARLGEDGRFVATGLRPDQHYWLFVNAPGLGSRTYALPRPLSAGERLDVGEVILRAAGGVEGRVVDEDGDPWADVEVSISGSNADSHAWGAPAVEVAQFMTRRMRADARGVFRCTALAAGKYELAADVPGRSPPNVMAVEVVDGEIQGDVRFVVPRGLSIAGTLRYADGRRIGDERSSLVLSARSTGGDGAATRVGADGRFSVGGLGEGMHTVTLLRAPKGWSMSPRAGVPAGTKDLDLVLQPASWVRGRVTAAGGKPVKARVMALADGAESVTAGAVTDDEGRFAIEVPPDFRGRVVAQDLQFTLAGDQVDGVEAGRHDLELKLKQPVPR